MDTEIIGSDFVKIINKTLDKFLNLLDKLFGGERRRQKEWEEEWEWIEAALYYKYTDEENRKIEEFKEKHKVTWIEKRIDWDRLKGWQREKAEKEIADEAHFHYEMAKRVNKYAILGEIEEMENKKKKKSSWRETIVCDVDNVPRQEADQKDIDPKTATSPDKKGVETDTRKGGGFTQ